MGEELKWGFLDLRNIYDSSFSERRGLLEDLTTAQCLLRIIDFTFSAHMFDMMSA